MSNQLYKKVIKFTVICGLVIQPFSGFGQSFEKNLTKIGALYDSKKYQELYNVVQPTKANNNLKDVMNNIYDLRRNAYDWTAEAYSTSDRVERGGIFLSKDFLEAHILELVN